MRQQTPGQCQAKLKPLETLQIIIQARMTSTRLPGKVMLPMADKPVLQWLLERLAPLKQHIIIATTNDGTEAPIVELCQNLGIHYFQGSTDDVLARYYLAAKHYNANLDTAIMRLTSDCPLLDVNLVQECVNVLRENDFDMVSLGPHSGYPRGLDTCIFNFDLLESTHKLATAAPDREHVTLGMSKVKKLNSKVLFAPQDLTKFRLTLDEPDDFKAISRVYQLMNYRTNFTYAELESLLLKHPEIAMINQHVEQKQI